MVFDFLQPVKRSTGPDYVSPLNPSYDPETGPLSAIVLCCAKSKKRLPAMPGAPVE
jgi:hypothetical protein